MPIAAPTSAAASDTEPPDRGPVASPDSTTTQHLSDHRLLGTRSRRALFVEGIFASGADAAMPFLPVYLVVLGASSAQVGLLSAATALAGLVALFPAAWVARRTPSRVRVLMAGGWSMRVTVLLIALAPMLLGVHAAVVALIALGGLRVLVASLAHPTWMSLFADTVPSRLAGAFNARRSLVGSVTAMTTVPLAGWGIGLVGGVEGYQVAFAVCATLGLLGTFYYLRVSEPARAPSHSPGHAYGKVLRDARYRRFLLAQMCLHGFATLSGPFVVVYMVRNLGASPGEVGLMATGDAIAAVAGQVLMGVLVSRAPSRRLFIGAIAGIAAAPVMWLMIASPWQAVLPVFLGGMSWAVCHLVVFNLLLEHAPSEDIPEYVAAQQLAMVSAGFAGPLIGTILVAQVGIPVVFAISAVGRLLAVPLFAAPVPTWVRLGAWARGRLDPEAASG